MATAWVVPAVGWAIIVVGWWISPVIAFVLPRIFSFLKFDASEKVQGLDINIIPELENTLCAVDEKRMLNRGKKLISEVARLDKMAAMLRRAREEAEDIFDDAQEIELYRNRWLQRLRCVIKARIGVGNNVTTTAAASDRLVPGTTTAAASVGLSHEPVPVTTSSEASDKPIPLTARAATSDEPQALVTAPAELFDFIKEWLCIAVGFAYFLRDRSCQVIGITSNQENGRNIDSHCSGCGVAPCLCTSSYAAGPVLANIDIAAASGEPTAVAIDIPASDEQAVRVAATTAEASDEQALLVATPSDLASSEPVPVMEPSDLSCSALDSDEPAVPVRWYFFKSSCSSVFNWLDNAIVVASFYRNWSYGVVGITSYQEKATMLDFLLTAISRRNLKKRIEKVKSTISEVKKSPLLGSPSKSAPDDVANKNRSRITATSNCKVFGREALRDSIMAKLRENPHGTSPCYSVIGIYGVAGSGKTTFARYIRDFIKDGSERLFDTIMCIHVSETFSVDDIFHEMLNDITKNRHPSISHHEELEEKLKESLKGKRFFLILDDLCVKSKSDPQLQELISPLNVGMEGSKILVTARTRVAAGALCADIPMKMPDLDKHQYLSMFMHYALGGTSAPDKILRSVGRDIAKKLYRSPIAATIVGGQLGANRDISFWESTAKLDVLNGTMDSLWCSYQQLSPDIRRCFEYCSIFPRKFIMKKGDLVHLWIVQGFIKTGFAREDMEDIAEGYIQELVSCSFLQPKGTSLFSQDCFTIHDLLHDLLDKVTGSDCFRIENARRYLRRRQRGGFEGDVPRDIHHLFIQNYGGELITEEILGLVNLRTLIFYDVEEDMQVMEKIIESISKGLPKLRVLFIVMNPHCTIKLSANEDLDLVSLGRFIEKSIGRLNHLRSFSFRTGPLHFDFPKPTR